MSCLTYGKNGIFRCGIMGIGRRRKISDFTHKTPQALHETGGTLNTFFGPDHIAFWRRIGKHEPARRIGSECADDIVGINRVPL